MCYVVPMEHLSVGFSAVPEPDSRETLTRDGYWYKNEPCKIFLYFSCVKVCENCPRSGLQGIIFSTHFYP